MSYYLLFGILLFLFLTQSNAEFLTLRNSHVPRSLTDSKLSYVAKLSNVTNLNELLDKICIPRVVGTSGHDKVHDYIVSQMTDLGWDIEVDSFTDRTPNFGSLKFRNIIATKNPNAARYLVLACHYDSKYYKDIEFLGATDSAVPCAMMINLARVMKKELEKNAEDVSLKMLFFDGEEAFHQWGPQDSIYGARHLAVKYENEYSATVNGDKVSQLDRIDLLVLLDLLGAPNPQFYSYFRETNKWYLKLIEAEQGLRKLGFLKRRKNYFQDGLVHAFIEDDHIPFLRRGVPILHVIPSPFPQVWHTVKDNREAIDLTTTEDLNKILRVFVAEYLHLVNDEDVPDDEDTPHIEL